MIISIILIVLAIEFILKNIMHDTPTKPEQKTPKISHPIPGIEGFPYLKDKTPKQTDSTSEELDDCGILRPTFFLTDFYDEMFNAPSVFDSYMKVGEYDTLKARVN